MDTEPIVDAAATAWWFWVPWLLAGLSFQIWAIFSKKTGNKLTTHWRWVRDVHPVLTYTWVSGWLVFFVWIILHWPLDLI